MRVLIIDNYDSFVYNLVQYVGELGGRPLVYRNDEITLERAKMLEPDRIILSPGPGSPQDPKYVGSCIDIIKELGPKIPILGVCLGHQSIIYAFGGKIVKAKRLMHGKTSLIRHDGTGLFKNVKNPLRVARYHSLCGERKSLPSCLVITAESIDDYEIMGVRHIEHPIEGVQFHPESVMCEDGKKILKNFLDGF
ncbi:MAG: aminodeoxychorismate/anthranilate synthase component II [Nitrososphaerota archaeon]